jgi:hypothetical protein
VIGGLSPFHLAIPKLVLWDDILLGLVTLLLAFWKKRKDPPASNKPPIDSNARPH